MSCREKALVQLSWLLASVGRLASQVSLGRLCCILRWIDVGTAVLLEVEQAACIKSQIRMSAERGGWGRRRGCSRWEALQHVAALCSGERDYQMKSDDCVSRLTSCYQMKSYYGVCRLTPCYQMKSYDSVHELISCFQMKSYNFCVPRSSKTLLWLG